VIVVVCRAVASVSAVTNSSRFDVPLNVLPVDTVVFCVIDVTLVADGDGDVPV
jgi:hypothetical protein